MKTAIATLALVATLGAAGDTQFRSIYRAPASEATSFVGRKVAVVVMTTDDALRMSAEEALVRVLAARGINAVAAWKMIPREEMQDKEQARHWFEQAGVEGAVVLRPIQMERTVTKYAPGWTTSYYQSFWGYYGSGVVAAYTPGHTTTDTIVVVETIVYDLRRNLLLWGAVSETADPKNMDAYMKRLVGDAAKEMQKAGLISKAK
jgi:hypothetical protein